MLDKINIGLSGIVAANKSLATVGRNITNSSVVSYHKRTPYLETSIVDAGVRFGYEIRTGDEKVHNSLYDIMSQKAYHEDISDNVHAIESLLDNYNIAQQINNVYNMLNELPGNLSRRWDFMSALSQLVYTVSDISDQIGKISSNIRNKITLYVNEVNNNLDIIASSNEKIKYEQIDINSIYDNIDARLESLSPLLGVRIVRSDQSINLLADDGKPLVLNDKSFRLDIAPIGNSLTIQNADTGDYKIVNGRLGALLYIYNTYLPELRSALDHIISDFMRNINQVQATGLGLLPGYDELKSNIPVTDIYQPLATANMPYSVNSGILTISVTDINNNTRNNYNISIDPNLQSLADIANAISVIPGLSATADATTGLLTLRADPGFLFDFAGRDTNPPSGGPVLNPDTAGILSALGIHPLFYGYNLDTMRINNSILENPDLLSIGRTGYSGDYSNIDRFLQTKITSLFTSNNIIQKISDLLGGIGSFSETSYAKYDNSSKMYDSIFDSYQQIVGVDTNEEFVNLIAYQRMFQASSKYISTVNSLFESLLETI